MDLPELINQIHDLKDDLVKSRQGHITMFVRYLTLLDVEPIQAKKEELYTSHSHLAWMCYEMVNKPYPLDKMARWLGFVQGVLVCKGIITVTKERDFSRPLFTK